MQKELNELLEIPLKRLMIWNYVLSVMRVWNMYG